MVEKNICQLKHLETVYNKKREYIFAPLIYKIYKYENNSSINKLFT